MKEAPVNHTRVRSGQQHAGWLMVVIATWAIGWWLAPSVGVFSFGTWLYKEDAVAAIILGTGVSLAVLGGLSVWQQLRGCSAWRHHWTIALLIVPAILFLWLPFRVGGLSVVVAGVPAWAYILMSVVHVMMQQYLTFWWLQTALERRSGPWRAVFMTAVAFYTIHALLLPDKFAPLHWPAALAILAMGAACASLRRLTGTIYLTLAAHLAFYGALL